MSSVSKTTTQVMITLKLSENNLTSLNQISARFSSIYTS